jgi:hypothetical protein
LFIAACLSGGTSDKYWSTVVAFDCIVYIFLFLQVE